MSVLLRTHLSRGTALLSGSPWTEGLAAASSVVTTSIHRQQNCSVCGNKIRRHDNKQSYLYSRQLVQNMAVTPLNYTPRTYMQTLVCSHAHLRKYNHSKLSLLPVFNNSHRQLSLNTKVLLEAAPIPLQPYLRLIRFEKPIGSFLLFWPCTWSISLAAEAGHFPSLYLLALFGAGSFFMRGAGCIINDMWDKDFDSRVERTKLRPLASGELSYFQSLCCLGVNLSISLAILLQLNNYSVVLGASSMLLVVLYPLAKRYTNWPQIMLGLTLNWGVLLAWSHLHGSLELAVLPLYTACIFYTIFYDTIYSHQDKYDDMLIGVKSTALTLGENTKPWLAAFSAVMISGLTTTGLLCDQTWPYYTAVGATAAHLFWQLYTVDLNNPDDCFAKFKSNSRLGLMLMIGIVAGTLLKEKTNADQEETTVVAQPT